MGCFFACSGDSNKKKRSENPNHNPKDIINSNFKNKAQDRTSSTAAAGNLTFPKNYE